MVMKYRLFDIGGSGVKTALVINPPKCITINTSDVIHYSNPDWKNFIKWCINNGLLDCDIIGISTAGFIDAYGKVIMFRAGAWYNKDLITEIGENRPGVKVFLLNDAEAHLTAHSGLYPFPQMSISLGTSLGFAISDQNGNIVRTLANINFDIGELALPTRATNNRVWWALGSHGLAELQSNLGETKGVEQFGYRLGSFLTNICSIFRPKSVIFSGGITDNWWNVFENTMVAEFNHSKPDWLENPGIYKSPFGINAALIGIGKYVSNK